MPIFSPDGKELAKGPHAIEKELIKVSGFEAARDYKRRQDYLAALARSVDQYFASVNDDGFDDLTKEAAEWFNAAARAVSNKKVIPEFGDEVAPADIPMPEPDEPVTDEELVEEPVDEPTLPVRKVQPPKRKGNYQSTIPPGRELPHPEITPEGEALEKVVSKIRVRPKDSTFGKRSTADMDKWGFAIGSKNSAAAALFEKGCRMADVKATLGGTYYNAIGLIIKRGHKVVHEANKIIRATYREKPGRKEAKDA